MADTLRLQLLGGLHVTTGGRPVTGFVSRKAQALLCYLAVTGRPQARETLAGLLWGDQPEATARTNLRQALANLNKLVGPYLASDRATVAINPAAHLWLDVSVFEAQLQRLPRSAERMPPDPKHLQATLALYEGDFLDGFVVPDAPDFDEWAAGQRERLRQLALHGFETLATELAARADYPAGIAALQRLLALDSWREEAHRQLMQLLALSGQRGAALAQYATCRRVLIDELGVEPEAETTALNERIRAGPIEPPASEAAAGSPHPRPEPAGPIPPPAVQTSFIGREAELAQITAHLADPACRLVTLTGPGGVRKTRLAVHAASDSAIATAFPDGVAFVSLSAVSKPDLVTPAIAHALGLVFAGPDDPTAQLLRVLHDRRLLLVLDSLEHLIAATDVLTAILNAAPDIKLLATSRQRLAIQAEWLLEVAGLDLPGEGTETAVSASTAVRLFVERARQVHAGFRLSSVAGDGRGRGPHLPAGRRPAARHRVGGRLGAVPFLPRDHRGDGARPRLSDDLVP